MSAFDPKQTLGCIRNSKGIRPLLLAYEQKVAAPAGEIYAFLPVGPSPIILTTAALPVCV